MAGKGIVVEILAEVKEYKEKLAEAEHATESLAGKLNKGLKMAAGAALGGLVAIGKIGWDNMKENEDATVALNDALSRSSRALRAQKGELVETAEALSKKTKFSVADVDAMETAIAKNQAFTGVLKSGAVSAGDLTDTVANLATVMHTDGASAADKLAKALAKPEGASRSLLAAGVVLTAQQQKQIKAWDKHGEAAKSQELILHAVEKATKNAAEAAGTTMTGKMAIAKHSFEETAGKLTTALLPALTSVLAYAQKFTDWAAKNPAKIKTIAEVVGGLALAVWGINAAVKVWKATQEAFNLVQAAGNKILAMNPYVKIALLIIAIGGALVYAYKHSETFRNIVNAAFKDVQKVVGVVVGFIKSHWELLVGIITGPVGFAIVEVIKHFNTIKGAISKVVASVKTAFSDAASWLISTGKHIIDGLVKGIEDAAMAPIHAIEKIGRGVKSAFSKIMGIFSPSKVMQQQGKYLIDGLVLGITDNSTAAQNAIKKVGQGIKDKLTAMGDLVKSARDIGSGIVSALSPQLSGPDATSGMSTLDQLKKQMTDTSSLNSGIAKLAAEHLNKGLLSQLVNGGTGSLDAINDLLGGGQNSVNLANKYSTGIGNSSRSIANAEAMRQTGVGLGKDGNTVLSVTVNGSVLSEHDLLKTIQRAVRNGGGLKAVFG